MYTVTTNGVLKTIESWSIIVPLHDNAGNRFEKTIVDNILQKLLLNYPGFSITNSVGYWRGSREVHIDENYQVLIDSVPDDTSESSTFFAKLKQDLQTHLHQEKVYVTKQSSKQELLSFDEFFAEVGVHLQSSDIGNQATQIVKEMVKRIDFVLQRLGYQTVSLRRRIQNKKIIWERKLCGIKLTSEFEDTLPDNVRLIASDQFAELGEALAREEPFAIIGSYEFQLYVLETNNHRCLVEANNTIGNEYKNPYSFSPMGEPLNVKKFIEEFTMSVFTNWLILREEGFLPEEIKMSVGADGSLQWTSRITGNVVLHSPASIPENAVQTEIIKSVAKAAHLYEDNAADPIAVLQAKAKNNYFFKRAIVRHTLNSIH